MRDVCIPFTKSSIRLRFSQASGKIWMVQSMNSHNQIIGSLKTNATYIFYSTFTHDILSTIIHTHTLGKESLGMSTTLYAGQYCFHMIFHIIIVSTKPVNRGDLDIFLPGWLCLFRDCLPLIGQWHNYLQGRTIT